MYLPALGATTNYSFTGVTSDGRTLTVQFTTANAITSATTLTSGQVSCAPACDDIAILPNSSQRDLLVIDVRTGGTPLAYAFALPLGAFATPGTYSTVAQSGAFNSGTLSVQGAALPAINTQSPLTNGVVSGAYSLALSASGGTGPYSFLIVDPVNAPPGLTLAANGVLQGIPSSIGTFTFQVRVTDTLAATTTRSFTLTVNAGVNITTAPTLPNGGLQLVYSQTLAAAGGTPGYTWSVTAGSLPPGLTLAPSGVISGVPTLGGSYSFTARATDSAAASGSQTFTISVPSVLSISTTPLGYGAIGAPYQQNFSALGGNPPYTWSVVSTLPAGLTMSQAGVLSGTPTISSNSIVTVRVADVTGNLANLSFNLSIVTGVTATSVAQLPPAPLNVPYLFNFAAVGGNPPYTWLLAAGTLPAGLTLTPGGVLSGTPTNAGTFNFTLRLNDATNNLAINTYSIVVGSSPAITTATTLPTGASGVAYSQTLAVTGGAAPYSWAVSGGSLPPGLQLAANGVLSGTPTTGGTYNFIVRLTDNSGSVAVQAFSVTIGTALSISTASPLPSGTAGVLYTQTLAATGGSPPYFWTLSSGSVPPGLTLSTTGVLSGTPTTPVTNSPLTIRVTDNTFASVTKDFTITIGSTGLGLAITSPATLPSGSLLVAYSTALTASGGVPPYSWSIAGGSIPPGLTLAPTTGVLSGTPSAAGVYTLTARVTDASNTIVNANLTVTIASGVVITTNAINNAVVGSAFSQNLSAAGGTPGYLWSFASGNLTPGLTISTNGVLSGTPTATGSFQFVIRVQDSSGAFTTQAFTQTVTSGISITTPTVLPNGAVGVLYSQTLAVSGGVGPYFWSLNSGSLTPGLTISTGGLLSGTPQNAGTSTFTIRVNDSAGAQATQTFSLTVGSGLSITTTTLPNGNVGTLYSQSLTATGGTTPYFWSVASGAVPPGLTLSTTGVLAGTPSTAGSYTMQVRVNDASSAAATQNFTIVIGAGLTITTTSPLPNAAANSAYSQTLAVSGGTAPYFWSLFGGTLPPGLQLSLQGALTGTPTAAGTYTFQVRVQDSVGANTTQSFNLTVGASTTITITTPSPLPNGSLNTVYTQFLAATGGTGPYTWSVASGTLPPGINLALTGQLLGIPTSGGEYDFTIRVTDAAQLTGTQVFKLTITGGITITTPNPVPDGTVSVNYSLALTATGGAAPYTWAVFSGNPPAGLTLSTTGVLSGLPTTAGTYSFVIRAVDAAGQSGTQNITITINATAVAPRAGVITQLASGGGWKTTMVLLNVGTTPANVKVNFAQDDGTPLSLPFVITQQGASVTVVGTTIERSIPANTTLLIESEAPGTVTHVGWADVRSSSTISGYAIFRQRGGDGRDSEGTSILENRVVSSVILPYDNTAGFITGIALSNLNATGAASLTASIRDDSGTEVARDTITIPANGHTSFAVSDRLPATAGKRGFVEFTSTTSSGISGLGLRFSPTLSFTSIPVVIR
jgi:hypothetical protein